MPRRLRLEFEGAIYHVVARGNGGQDIVRDDGDRTRFRDDLARGVTRSGWELLAFALMQNHFHLLLKTPRANLARGMQTFLSSYAHGCLRRWGQNGRLFQGRYRADMIEDSSYYWPVSRYIHLNPVRAGLVAHPRDWPWSSYPSYASQTPRLPWIAYHSLLGAWPGGEEPDRTSASYVAYVDAGVVDPPTSPFADAIGGWALGSRTYVSRLRALAAAAGAPPAIRQLSGLDAGAICATVIRHYGLEPSSLLQRHDRRLTPMRAMAAWLCRQYTEATLRDLALRFGLSRPDSVPNLTRRFEASLTASPTLSAELKKITQKIVRQAAGRGGQPPVISDQPHSQ